jgi:hypothetical protein
MNILIFIIQNLSDLFNETKIDNNFYMNCTNLKYINLSPLLNITIINDSLCIDVQV